MLQDSGRPTVSWLKKCRKLAAGASSAIIAVMISSLWVVREMLRLVERESEAEKVMVRLEEAEKLITTLRSKHHDFVNHLQVILGLIQLKMDNDAADYIKGLSKDLIQIEKLVSLERP